MYLVWGQFNDECCVKLSTHEVKHSYTSLLVQASHKGKSLLLSLSYLTTSFIRGWSTRRVAVEMLVRYMSDMHGSCSLANQDIAGTIKHPLLERILFAAWGLN